MYCAQCGQHIPGDAGECPKCSGQVADASRTQVYNKPAKSKVAYVIIGVFFGSLGIHDFYAGYSTNGVIKLLITILSCSFLSIVSWIWAIVDVCTITVDSDGQPFE